MVLLVKLIYLYVCVCLVHTYLIENNFMCNFEIIWLQNAKAEKVTFSFLADLSMNLTNAVVDTVVALRHLLVIMINYKMAQLVEFDAFLFLIKEHFILLYSSP